MKTYQLLILLFLLSSCDSLIEDDGFLQEKWKVQSLANEKGHLKVPSNNHRDDAYILHFYNDSIYDMPTGNNSVSGKYHIISDGQIVVSDRLSTHVGGSSYQMNFDDQLFSIFDGIITYSYKKNKLIFRGEKGGEITFRREK